MKIECLVLKFVTLTCNIIITNVLNVKNVKLGVCDGSIIMVKELFKTLLHKAYDFGYPEGLTSILATHPFDTIKVRLQSVGTIDFGEGEFLYTGATDCFTKIIKREGFHSLYRGISLPLVTMVPTNVFTCYAYNLFSDSNVNDKKLTGIDVFQDGMISGILPAPIVCPMERIKCELQVPHGYYETIRTPVSVVKEIYQTQGLGGFSKGLTLTTIRDGFCTGMIFLSFYILKANYKEQLRAFEKWAKTDSATNKRLKYVGIGFSGGISGIIASFLLTPVDFLKTRYQLQKGNMEDVFKGMRSEANRREISMLRLSYSGAVLIMVRGFFQYTLVFLGFQIYKDMNKTKPKE